MKELSVWVRNLTGYVLFLAVLDQIMPDKEKGKYVRLFSGMVLVILLVQPVVGPTGILIRAAHRYQELELNYDTSRLKDKILDVERQKYSKILETYEMAVAGEIMQMADKEGYEGIACQVMMERDREKENFGQITGIHLKLRQAAAQTAHTISYLQKRIAADYGLEENDVQIEVFTG